MGAQGQQQPTDVTTKKDTINTRVIPIVLVPGVMGTRLSLKGSSQDWDPDDLPEMGLWLPKVRELKMRLVDPASTPAKPLTDLDGNLLSGVKPGVDIAARDRLKQIALDQLDPKLPSRARPSAIIKFWGDRGWGEVVWSFYGLMLMDLAEKLNPGDHGGETRPVYACGYDWRESNGITGPGLARRLRQILAKHPLAKKLILVTHSMGGLVTRAALKQGAEASILGVVHTVIPADGAVVAYRRFFTGARDEFDGAEPLNNILGPNPIEYAMMQSVLPGPTELLPHNSYPDVFVRFQSGTTNKNITDLFAMYAQQTPPGIIPSAQAAQTVASGSLDANVINLVPNLRNRLLQAQVFTDSIAGVFHPQTALLFGDGIPTDTLFDLSKGTPTADGSGMAAMVSQPLQGDGTVPRASARFRACQTNKRNGQTVKHADCFKAEGFRNAVLGRVRELLQLPP